MCLVLEHNKPSTCKHDPGSSPSVQGTYIANVVLPTSDDYDDYDLDPDAPRVESRITFNGGGDWMRIPAPRTFTNPACNRCIGSDCFLHLRR